MEEGYTVAEQTGNSSKHSIGTDPRCRVSSLSSTIFGNHFAPYQVSRSILATALSVYSIPNDENKFPRVFLSLFLSKEYDPPVLDSRYAQLLLAKNVFSRFVMNLAKRSIKKLWCSLIRALLSQNDILVGVSCHRYDNVIQM